jgi:hypothetical protein
VTPGTLPIPTTPSLHIPHFCIGTILDRQDPKQLHRGYPEYDSLRRAESVWDYKHRFHCNHGGHNDDIRGDQPRVKRHHVQVNDKLMVFHHISTTGVLPSSVG